MISTSSVQDEDGEGKSSKGEDASKARRKTVRKLEKMKLQRSLGQCSFSAGHYAVYEMRIKKLKKNNRDLAKALADQKIETHQWYSEVVSLKGELQEAQEKLLAHADDNLTFVIQHQVDKQLQDVCEPLKAAISSAIEHVVEGVESLTKVKQLAASLTNNSRSSSSRSSSLLRVSGSRLPLAPGSSNLSPQNVVLPMVSGHVLQPARVPIQKLNIAWEAKMRERSQASNRDLDMSIIGEQSVVVSASESEESSSAADGDTTNTTNTTTTPSQRLSVSDSSPQMSTEQASPQSRRSQRNRGGGSRNDTVRAQARGRGRPICSISPTTPPASTSTDSGTTRTRTTRNRSRSPRVSQVSPLRPVVPESSFITSSSPSPVRLYSMAPSLLASPALSTTLASPTTVVSPFPTVTSSLSVSPMVSPAVDSRVALSSPTEVVPSSAPTPSPQKSVNRASSRRSKFNQALEDDEDPLEGPSWWYNNGVNSRVKGRGRGRGARGRPKSQGRVAASKSPKSSGGSWHFAKVNVINSSSDNDEDDRVSANKTASKSPTKSKESPTENEETQRIPAEVLDRSYLSSPATMLARLEALEAAGGRRSKARSRGRTSKHSIEPAARPSDDFGNSRRRTQQGRYSVRPTKDTVEEEVDHSLNLRLDLSLNETTNTSPINIPSAPSSPVSRPNAPQEFDFRIPDSDMTCVNITSMDMTLPVSNIITHVCDEVREQPGSTTEVLDSRKAPQSEKRFFKNQVEPQIQENTKQAEKTPFDLSLMDASGISIPPFSSQRTTEKENLPPNMIKVNGIAEEEPCLRRVSIVLQDCMREKRNSKLETPSDNLTSEPESSKSSGKRNMHKETSDNSPIKKKPVKRRTLNYNVPSIHSGSESEDDEDDDALWVPTERKKRKENSESTESTSVYHDKVNRKKAKSLDKAPTVATYSKTDKRTGRRTTTGYTASSSSKSLISKENVVSGARNGQSHSDEVQQENMVKDCFVNLGSTDTVRSSVSPACSPSKTGTANSRVDITPSKSPSVAGSVTSRESSPTKSPSKSRSVSSREASPTKPPSKTGLINSRETSPSKSPSKTVGGSSVGDEDNPAGSLSNTGTIIIGQVEAEVEPEPTNKSHGKKANQDTLTEITEQENKDEEVLVSEDEELPDLRSLFMSLSPEKQSNPRTQSRPSRSAKLNAQNKIKDTQIIEHDLSKDDDLEMIELASEDGRAQSTTPVSNKDQGMLSDIGESAAAKPEKQSNPRTQSKPSRSAKQNAQNKIKETQIVEYDVSKDDDLEVIELASEDGRAQSTTPISDEDQDVRESTAGKPSPRKSTKLDRKKSKRKTGVDLTTDDNRRSTMARRTGVHFTIDDSRTTLVSDCDDGGSEHGEVSGRRKRRAASKVTSLKEVSLNRKMRKTRDNEVEVMEPPSRRRM